MNVFIGCGKATHFIMNDESAGLQKILLIALITGGICLLQFQWGRLPGAPKT